MKCLFIDSRTKHLLLVALSQIKRELSAETYARIESIILSAILNKQLIIYDINLLLNLISYDLQPGKKYSKKTSNMEDSIIDITAKSNVKYNNDLIFDHLLMLRLLRLYRMKILYKYSEFKKYTVKGCFIMSNPDACKAFRDRIKATPSKSNVSKNTNTNKNTNSGGHGEKGNHGRTPGGHTR